MVPFTSLDEDETKAKSWTLRSVPAALTAELQVPCTLSPPFIYNSSLPPSFPPPRKRRMPTTAPPPSTAPVMGPA